MRGNGAAARKLSIGVHTSECVGHTIRGGTCSHIVGVECATRAATRSHAEIGFACQHAFFFVSAGHRMLETCRVGGVAGDAHIHIFVPHDGHTLAHIVGTIAVHFGARSVAVGFAAYLFQFAGVVVEFGLHVCKSVDAADNHGGIFTQAIQNAAQRFLTHFVGHFGYFDGTFGGCERLVSGQKGETFGLFAQQTCSQVTMSETHFAVVGYRTRDAESLQAYANGFGGIGSIGTTFFQSDGRTHNVSPFGIFEADFLRFFAGQIGV